jgi:glutathione S-transferase
MPIVLYHHPFSRAAGVLWMLEEVGVEYELRFVDIRAGAQKGPEILALNPMGKLPIVVDGELVMTETAAIGLYLADRYAPGRLAPALDAPARGTYLRWSLFAPSVIEPGLMAKAAGWTVKEGQAGWGNHDAMLDAMESALSGRDYLLGDDFSMADIIFGGTVRFMLGFKMLEPRPVFSAYAERLGARPALQRADAKNAAIREERNIRSGG